MTHFAVAGRLVRFGTGLIHVNGSALAFPTLTAWLCRRGGVRSGSDGNGRNASDNNTLNLLACFAF